jgi:predicted transcriptional regulator of viral defense system
MEEIARIRQAITLEVFDYQVLMSALSDYSKPRDKITKLLAGGAIIRIKKGLYCFSESLRREPIIREHVANLIYGPSYVSLDYALSYHGLIPERVEVVTSVTTRRSRAFETPIGSFSYRMLHEARYATGAVLEAVGATTFLIATPEKALVDKVWTDSRFSGNHISDFGTYLLDDLRIDEEALGGLMESRLESIARAYDSAKINRLVRYIERLRRISDA